MARLWKTVYCEEGIEDKIDEALVKKIMNTTLGQKADFDMDEGWDEVEEEDGEEAE